MSYRLRSNNTSRQRAWPHEARGSNGNMMIKRSSGNQVQGALRNDGWCINTMDPETTRMDSSHPWAQHHLLVFLSLAATTTATWAGHPTGAHMPIADPGVHTTLLVRVPLRVPQMHKVKPQKREGKRWRWKTAWPHTILACSTASTGTYAQPRQLVPSGQSSIITPSLGDANTFISLAIQAMVGMLKALRCGSHISPLLSQITPTSHVGTHPVTMKNPWVIITVHPQDLSLWRGQGFPDHTMPLHKKPLLHPLVMSAASPMLADVLERGAVGGGGHWIHIRPSIHTSCAKSTFLYGRD